MVGRCVQESRMRRAIGDAKARFIESLVRREFEEG